MTVIATIAMKCPNMKSPFWSKIVWVRAPVYLINLQWDDWATIAMKCPNSNS